MQNQAANDADGVDIATFSAMNAARSDVCKRHGVTLAPCFMNIPDVSPTSRKQFCATFDDRFVKGTYEIYRVCIPLLACCDGHQMFNMDESKLVCSWLTA